MTHYEAVYLDENGRALGPFGGESARERQGQHGGAGDRVLLYEVPNATENRWRATLMEWSTPAESRALDSAEESSS